MPGRRRSRGGGTVKWERRAACERERPQQSPPPSWAAQRQLCPLQEGSLATPPLGQPLEGREGTCWAPDEEGAPWKKNKNTLNPHLQEEDSVGREGGRGGQRNPHANLAAAGSSTGKRIHGSPGELCPSRAEGMRMRSRLHRAAGGCSSVDSSRPVRHGWAPLQHHGQLQFSTTDSSRSAPRTAPPWGAAPAQRRAAPRASRVKRTRPRRAHVSCCT